MQFNIDAAKNEITIWRERPATKAERKVDPEAKIMAEVVSVRFGTGEPRVVCINRDLCA